DYFVSGIVIVPPVASSVARSAPTSPFTNLSSVSYAVNFSQTVTGVDPSDFQVITTGPLTTALVAVTGSGSTYIVTVSGIHGNGNLQLELVDNDSINNGANVPLAGTINGSFLGQSYTMLQAGPRITSISRSSPLGPTTSATSVNYAVTFSSAV